MFYTPEERNRLSQESPTMYAELAHEYPCCDLPIVTDCAVCSIDPEKCSNKAEIKQALERAKESGNAWLQDGEYK